MDLSSSSSFPPSLRASPIMTRPSWLIILPLTTPRACVLFVCGEKDFPAEELGCFFCCWLFNCLLLAKYGGK